MASTSQMNKLEISCHMDSFSLFFTLLFWSAVPCTRGSFARSGRGSTARRLCVGVFASRLYSRYISLELLPVIDRVCGDTYFRITSIGILAFINAMMNYAVNKPSNDSRWSPDMMRDNTQYIPFVPLANRLLVRCSSITCSLAPEMSK